MTLTLGSRSNLTLPMNSSDVVFNVQYISYVYLAPIRCYRLLKCDGTVYDLDLRVKVKFDITNF